MKIKLKKFDEIAKKLIVLGLQVAIILEILGIFILSKSFSIYQYQLAKFIMQTSIVILGEGFLFGVLANRKSD